MIEIFIFGILILTVFIVNGQIDTNKFIKDNKKTFNLLKEDDYEFLVAAKYGDSADAEKLFEARIRNGLVTLLILIILFISRISFLNLIFALAGAYLIFKSGYSNLKSYYKKRLHDIDLLLPYYLKMLEVLIQYYTVPVAISRSIEDAPEIFRPGLRKLITKIEEGDSSIDPYMDFAKEYPVRDSMRMMRLL